MNVGSASEGHGRTAGGFMALTRAADARRSGMSVCGYRGPQQIAMADFWGGGGRHSTLIPANWCESENARRGLPATSVL